MNTSLIVAIDQNNGIIPWCIKKDLNYFIDVTKREYKPKLKKLS